MLVGKVYVGSPQKAAIPLLFDTNFDATVIMGPDCKTCLFPTYDPKSSASYVLENAAIYRYSFDSIVAMAGSRVKDTICLSADSNCAVNFTFVAGTSSYKLDPNISGVLGLTLNGDNSSAIAENRFIDTFFKSGSITERKFSTHLGTNVYVDFGSPVASSMTSITDLVDVKVRNGFFWS